MIPDELVPKDPDEEQRPPNQKIKSAVMAATNPGAQQASRSFFEEKAII